MSYINATESIVGEAEAGRWGEDRIRFYYTTEGLFNEVSLRTHYRAKTIKDQQGKSQTDDYAISEAERDAFLVFLDYAVKNVFAELVKLTKGVDASVFVNTDISGPPAVAASGFSIIDNGNFNSNVLDLVDINARESIILYIMKDWYKTIGHGEEYSRLTIEYMAAIIRLSNILFELRKKLIGT
jgi:hypothetical protein